MDTEKLSDMLNSTFCDEHKASLLDSEILSFLVCVFRNLDYGSFESIYSVTSVLAPILYSYRLTASLEDAEEIVTTLVDRAREIAPSSDDAAQGGLAGAEDQRLQTPVSVAEQVENSARLRDHWKSVQTSRDVAKQKMNYLVAKSDQRAVTNLAKRILRGKSTVFEEAPSKVQDFTISVSHGSSAATQNEAAICLEDISLAFGPNVLLRDCSFKFNFGRRYSLIGRNGTGKSSLLRAIANNEMPCIPQRDRYKILYVNQEVAPSDERVIDVVLASDEQYVRLTTQERLLQASLDIIDDFEASKLLGQSAASRGTASSAATPAGDSGRALLALLPRELHSLLNFSELLPPPSGADAPAAATAAAGATGADAAELVEDAIKTAVTAALQSVYTEFEELDIHNAKNRAGRILSGLQFTQAMQTRRTREFSGGWLMRISLAKALYVDPDILFLDEPDNHLDIHAILWLESYLREFSRSKLLVVVSHDTDFLNQFTTDIVLLQDKALKLYTGDYDTFARTRANELKNLKRAVETQEAKRAHVQQFIDRFRFNAKRAGLVQSRIKALGKMNELFYSSENDTAIDSFVFPCGVENAAAPGASNAPDAPGAQDGSYELLEMKDVAFSYSRARVGGFHLSSVNVRVMSDSRVAIVGANGSGKSTLLKLLAGIETPVDGFVQRAAKCRPCIFWQHHTALLDLDKTPLQTIREFSPGDGEREYRAHLGSFGIKGDLVFQPNRTLSGGQKSRLNFALLTYKSLPTLLIMDEPTNHLDIETRVALAEGLNNFNGAVILVSHDGQLIASVTEELWVVADGHVKPFNGNFDEYKTELRCGMKY